MPQLRVFKTESFRLAALFAALFIGFAAILFTSVYWIVDDMQTTALLHAVDSDINTIRNGFLNEGVPEAIEVVQQRLGISEPGKAARTDSYILLQTRDRTLLAGNLPPLPAELGVVSFAAPQSDNQTGNEAVYSRGLERRIVVGRGRILGTGVYLGPDTYLLVGRDTAEIAATRSRILNAFAWLTGATIVLAALGGVLFSLQFLRRIDAITRTCNSIMKGRFEDRIALRGSDDELDRLALAINGMLDRIAALLENLRQVSSDVAHDLRTPLAHLRRRLEDAQASAISAEDFSLAVQRAIVDIDELLAIFAALLRISQIESGTRLARFTAFSLSELLNKIYETYLPVAEDRGKTLVRSIEQHIDVHGDAELLLQLFSNLIENAIRHTPPGTDIAVALQSDGAMAVASVSDNGPGIPQDERDKVLRRFYRVARSRSSPGNGLGLALANAIGSLHQSKIELTDNHPGVRASIALPI